MGNMIDIVQQKAPDGTIYDFSGPDQAPVLVLIHGLGLNRNIWPEFNKAFNASYRVLQYDLYGHGQSAAPPRSPNLALYSEQIVGLLDLLSIDKAALIGFSLGGMINRRVAMDYPDRVTALGILNSPHERGEEQQRLVEERAKDSAAGGPGATIDATLKRWFTPSYLENNLEYIQQVREWVLANDPVLYAQCRFVLANGVVELIHPDIRLKTPTLVVTCENDSGSNPSMSVGIADEIDGAEIIIIPELQHMGIAERPELFINPLAGFLKQVL
ncbi:MAG: pimeloyl-ACP methyl ester carboxylesterase [Gammaproteobacteria bacterium]